ncbi:diguanylate cyclase (GGDEF) domain-containing protein [Maridesulfovibrio ferrireducens]|uniref:diguanylate cyclase n=1 Tax=Maridesulfovibrio ferrireducens TaxID=246191 RepID=A0A1G9CY24_9BACT|nr:sensor domain-containing diguanylate cyclase [Maridesulfovibrio ferrireducens]SDK56588.1 diguanylate cyclase (GGDEF) domain-containing protein [Maridesulfovibrio ferrireducens]
MTIDKFDFDATLLTINFATRLLAMELDKDTLLDRILETFCDMGSCKDAAIMTYNSEGNLIVAAASLNHERTFPNEKVPMTKAMEEAAQSRSPVARPKCKDSFYPLPGDDCEACNGTCLCLPLVGSRDLVKGFVTLHRENDKPWSISELFQLGIISTVAAIAYENSELFRQTIKDSLTGLYMRRYLFIRLEEETQRVKRRGGDLSVIMVDIDHFKLINDSYGHAAGDEALKQVANVLLQNSRRGADIVCRYGGEEFAVLMPGSKKEDAMVVAERMRAGCEEAKLLTSGGEFKITLSAGVANLDECDLISGDTMMRIADKRLYAAKKSGRNRVIFEG